MFPWGYKCAPLIPEYGLLKQASTKLVQAIQKSGGTRFKNGDICNVIYPASGSSVDYSYGSQSVVYSFAVELRDTGNYGFLLPAKQILGSGVEVFEGLLVLFGGIPKVKFDFEVNVKELVYVSNDNDGKSEKTVDDEKEVKELVYVSEDGARFERTMVDEKEVKEIVGNQLDLQADEMEVRVGHVNKCPFPQCFKDQACGGCCFFGCE